MSVSSTVMNALIVTLDVLDEGGRFESTAIGEIRLNNNTIVNGKLFESCLFGANSFNSGETHLMFDVNITTAVINKDTTTFVGSGRSLAKGIKCATEKSRFKMINRNLDSGFQVIHLKRSNGGIVSIRDSHRGRDRFRWAAVCFCKFADGASDHRHITFSSGGEFGNRERCSTEQTLNSR